MLRVIEPAYDSRVNEVRELFQEYWHWLGFAPCVQDFDEELRSLPGKYKPPHGCILLAFHDDELAGCVALRKLDKNVCEMKRLYVRPDCRGRGTGFALASAIIEQARKRGYKLMRLDTLPVMQKAIAIYKALGFREITPYTDERIQGAKYFEVRLS